MKKLLALTLPLALAAASHAALITSHTDTNTAAPVVDGVISADEYGPGNSYAYTGGGAGFGGQLGPATMYAKSDTNNLYLALSNIAVHAGGDMYVIYLDTGPGGYHPNGADMDDTSDLGRTTITRLSSDGDEYVTFEDLVADKPDYAIVINNKSDGFVATFELQGVGNTHNYFDITWAGLNSSVMEFCIAYSNLNINMGSIIDITAVLVSDTGFLSDEGIPDPGLASIPGFNNGNTTTFSDFHRFQSFANPFNDLTERRENVTLAMPQDPPSPGTNAYVLEDAFPGLTFSLPMHVASPPGETNRLFVLERAGSIIVITNLTQPDKTTFMTVPSVNTSGEGGLQGLAFHPDYASNGQFFVFYTRTHNNGTGNGFHTRVSRFLRSSTNENAGVPGSETILFSQYNQAANHNGGGIMFNANDGYLYIGLGDEGGSNDTYDNSQLVTNDFFASLMRIDVDMKPGNPPPNHHPALNGATNYAIPVDNPLIGITNYYGVAVDPAKVRTEFFATGLRNPFRIFIDDPSGLIYVADVGQNAWEEINLVTNGGNYGWAAREGFASGPINFGQPASVYANPVLAYGHGSGTNQGNSITGGAVYRGNKHPDLVENYIYADYEIGNIWAMTHDGVTNTSNRRLTSDARIVGIGTDPSNGDLLFCDLFSAQVKRLVKETADTGNFPAALSDTGAFADPGNLTPFEGIVPYSINVPFWSDNAIKSRWVSLPSTNLFFGFDADNDWHAPTTTVWIKHFDLLLTSGVPSSARRIETRILVKNGSGSGGYGVTYRWGNSTNDAVLVQEEGLNETLLINDSGTIRTQVWRYPSRAECLSCHNVQAGFALSFNTPQMNYDNIYGGSPTNQIAAFHHAGYFSNQVASLNLLRKLAHPTNESVSLSYRVKSYIEANCAQCHFPGGPSPAGFDARQTTAVSDAGLIDGILNNSQGDPTNRVIVRGDAAHSMLLNRISFRGAGQMPPVGSNLLDTQNIALVTAWILNGADGYETFEEWQLKHFGSTVIADAQPGSDPDGDGHDNNYEYLTSTQPTNAFDYVEMSVEKGGTEPGVAFTKTAGAGFDLQVSTSLTEGAWSSLDVPENAPVFEASTTMKVIPDPEGTNLTERYYRLNAYEP